MNTSREERRSALDEFADKMATPAGGELVPVPAGAPPLAMFAPLPPVGERDERRVLQKIKALAAAAGDDWYYRFPVQNRKENRTDWIEGPSIKLANEVARLYGNCDVDVRYLDLGNVFAFYARFVDRESGFSLTRPFQQHKSVARLGGADEGRREDIALQIGTSKAERNVVVNALQTFADFAFEEAKGALVDKIGRDLAKYRATTVERVSAHVDLARVEAVLGRKATDWLAPDVARVIAMMKAVQDGMATLDETFPPLTTTSEESGGGGGADMLDSFAASGQDTGADRQAGGAESDGPAPPDPALLREAIDKLMTLAAEDYPVEERLDMIEGARRNWAQVLGEETAHHVTWAAAQVAQGKMEPDAARQSLISRLIK